MDFVRYLEQPLRKNLVHPYVHILFGARQTGKTTLLRKLLSPALSYNLADPQERTRLLADPGIFRRECEAMAGGRGQVIWVDEAQLVPSVFDAIQVLHDRDPQRFRFVLSGSSARKLRETGANLLPGRSLLYRLYPMTLCERPAVLHSERSEPGLIFPMDFQPTLPAADNLIERLAYGDLPGIFSAEGDIRESLLRSYTSIYLEEEIRRETYVKDWGAFVNFLKIAAMESGESLNYAKVARQTGLSQPTVKSHYQLLEDMFVGFRVEAFSRSRRKNLLGHARFYFFDLGVRHAAAGLRPCPETVLADPGRCFEQWVGMELHRRLGYLDPGGRLLYFRTRDGMEVDFIVESGGKLIPIEVKWTKNPTERDARHLGKFLSEQPNAEKGYVVCRCPRPAQLTENVTAVPWWAL